MRPNCSMAVFTTRSPSGRLMASATSRQPFATGLLDARDRCDDVGLGAGGADDGCTRLGENSRDALADTLSGAGDDRNLTIQPELLQRHSSPLRRVADHLTALID